MSGWIVAGALWLLGMLIASDVVDQVRVGRRTASQLALVVLWPVVLVVSGIAFLWGRR